MIAFLVFFALMIAFIVGCVCISMYLGASNGTEYPSRNRRPQFVSLHQEAVIRGRSAKGATPNVGMLECAWRVAAISLGVVGVVVVLVIAFLSTTL